MTRARPSLLRRAAGTLLAALSLLLALGGTARADDCSMTMTTVNFGAVSPISSSDYTSTGTLGVTCNWTGLVTVIVGAVSTTLIIFPNVQVCVSLNTGTNSVGTSAAPRNIGGLLNYNLYLDSGYGTVWGGASASGAPTPFTALLSAPILTAATSLSKSFTLYGKIPAGTALAAVPTVANADTPYVSTFSAGAVTLSYQFYALIVPPACPTLNPTTATTFNVQATAINNCNIAVGSLGFGSSSLLSGPVSTSSSLSIQCTNNNSYQIALNGGTVSGNVASRKMKNTGTAETISYRISPTSGGTIWGDGTGSTVMVSGVGTGAAQSVTLFGQVPAQSTPSPGDYKDTVTATVSF
ncbi:spore coat U domain-containing protein [Rugamonas sp.]|uniref:Csu type fimbrial protein n=1 Tax=Rugamonas sp. TaxID=1926287 RepID=UPI0025DB9F56|nr:spore coat U domain-containing protein [Rugamonas sp.]